MSFRNINLLWEKIMAPRIRFLAVLIQGVYGYPLEPVEDVVMKHPVSSKGLVGPMAKMQRLMSLSVLAKRSLIKDLVLLRTKLLKWSFFGPFFYTKVLFFLLRL